MTKTIVAPFYLGHGIVYNQQAMSLNSYTRWGIARHNFIDPSHNLLRRAKLFFGVISLQTTHATHIATNV